MNTDKRQHLQDIYATDHVEEDVFTPQVSSQFLEERRRDIRRHRIISFAMGLIILILSISLIYVIVREYLRIQNAPPAPVPVAQDYIPRYSLSPSEQWVMDFSREYADPSWSGEGPRPFSAYWVKKAAYNIILAEQAANMHKWNDAAVYYENALEIFPKMEGIRIPLGSIYFRLKRYEEAIKLLQDLPEDKLTPDVLNNLGAACLYAKIYDRAEYYLKKAVEKDPSYPEPEKNLAELYRRQKRADEAVAAFEKYIDLNPTDTETRHAYALYLTQLGRWKEAADALESLTSEITDVPVLYFLLARVESHLGNSDKAIKALRRGMELSDPSAALAYMDDKEFDQLRQSDEFQQMVQSLEQLRKKRKRTGGAAETNAASTNVP